MIRLALLLSIIPIVVIGRNILSPQETLETETISVTLDAKNLRKQLECAFGFANLFIITQENGDKIYMDFPELEGSPIISSNLICDSFIDAWQAHLIEEGEEEFILDLSPIQEQINQVDAIPRLRNSSQNLTEQCLELGYCKNSSPFSLSKSKTESCQPQRTIRQTLRHHLPRLRRANPRNIKNVRVELFPQRTPIRLAKNIFQQNNQNTRLVSTMSLGGSLFQEILTPSQRYTGENFLLFDANLFYQVKLQKTLYKNGIPQNLFLIPMTSGQTFKSTYHMKIFMDRAGSEAHVTAANIASPRKSAYLDYIFSFSDSEILNELDTILARNIDEQCESIRDFECLSAFVEPNALNQEKIINHARMSCTKWHDRRDTYLPKTNGNEKYFLNPQRHDVPDYLERLIESADKEIVIYTHHLSEPKFLIKLQEAEKRGIRVFLFTAPTVEPRENWLPNGYINVAALPRKRASLIPHMKTILIDREKLFFGTGNFTTTGLTRSGEIFGTTHDKSAIKTILDLAASYYHAYAPRKKNPFMSKKENRTELVIIAPRDDYRVPHHLRPAYYRTNPEVHPAFGILTKRGRKLMRHCGLGHIKIVVEDDLVQCLNLL